MKNINWEDDRDIYGRMHLLTGDRLFLRLRNAVDHCNADLTDLLTWGQLKSKRWIIEELENITEKHKINLGLIFRLSNGFIASIMEVYLICFYPTIKSFYQSYN